jgi:hypothetical protein
MSKMEDVTKKPHSRAQQQRKVKRRRTTFLLFVFRIPDQYIFILYNACKSTFERLTAVVVAIAVVIPIAIAPPI